jgi:hypothetical protein
VAARNAWKWHPPTIWHILERCVQSHARIHKRFSSASNELVRMYLKKKDFLSGTAKIEFRRVI